MNIPRKGSTILRDYCENSSLVGLAYISNQKIHLTERIFWLICVVISAGGSYYLIKEYQNDFESKAISLVIEPAGPEDKTHFTGVGICETFSAKLNYPMLTEFMEQWKAKYKNHDSIYDIEDFLVRVIYINNMYSFGSLRDYCSLHFDCEDCVQCPMTGYKKLADLIRTNCSDLIINCVWNGKAFNCCDYFLPLHTPEGLCFIFNSEQTTKRKKTKKLDTVIGRDVGFGQLQFEVTHTIELHLLNPEDVPVNFRQALITKITSGATQQLQLRVESISNDPDVHEISPNYRRCKFSNENSKNSSYKYYSFTTCVIDCIKQIQLQICGCNSIGYMIKDDDRSVVCDYNGTMCLDKADFIRPQNKVMQPWLTNDFVCDCLPSCKEHEIQVVESSLNFSEAEAETSRIEITQTVSSQKYRRQTVRTQLDVVVTIGGILGLFLGASILSGIEILYFFLIRIFYIKVDDN